MKQRYFMCFLFSTAMLIYGFEYLPLNGSVVDQLFAWAWIVFAVMVISGNVLHLLYKKSEAGKRAVPLRKQEKVRARLRG